MSLKTKERPLISFGIGRSLASARWALHLPACPGLRTLRTADLHTPAALGSRYAPYGLAGCQVSHFLDVAMVRGYQHLSVNLGNCADQVLPTLIQRLDRRYSRGEVATVAHHVAVGVIAHDGVVLAAVNGLHQFLGYRCGAHLWLQIVGGDIG